MTQPQGNTIEFSNINHYDIDIRPTGVYLTIHTDTVTHTIKANIKPVTAAPIQVQKTTSTVAATPKKQPEVVAVHKTSSKPDYHKPHFNPDKSRWSKLTPEQVAEIKGIWPEIFEEYKQVTKASEFLAEIYGCSRANIELIVKGKTWADIKPKQK